MNCDKQILLLSCFMLQIQIMKVMDKMVMVIVGIFVFCNSFQILNYFLKNNIVESIADFFLTFNSSINAIVYGIYQKTYQEILLSTLPKFSHTDSIINRLPKF